MDFWIAILGFFVSGITCFAIGVRICGWGKRSIAEEYDRLLKHQEKLWTNALEEFRELFHRYVAAADPPEPRGFKSRDEKTFRLQKEIDHLLALHLGPGE